MEPVWLWSSLSAESRVETGESECSEAICYLALTSHGIALSHSLLTRFPSQDHQHLILMPTLLSRHSLQDTQPKHLNPIWVPSLGYCLVLCVCVHRHALQMCRCYNLHPS